MSSCASSETSAAFPLKPSPSDRRPSPPGESHEHRFHRPRPNGVRNRVEPGQGPATTSPSGTAVPGKADALVAAGATEAKTAADAASDAGIVFSMLADDAAVLSVLSGEDGLMRGLPERSLHVSLSTIAVATAERLAEQHAAHGQRYISAPVFGRPEAAVCGSFVHRRGRRRRRHRRGRAAVPGDRAQDLQGGRQTIRGQPREALRQFRHPRRDRDDGRSHGPGRKGRRAEGDAAGGFDGNLVRYAGLQDLRPR